MTNVIQLLIDNNPAKFDEVMQEVARHKDLLAIADYLEELTEEWLERPDQPTFEVNLVYSLARAAWEQVNWLELAQHYLDILKERK